ncbi:MAG: class I SAM-dependent methyltransferase [Mariprofundaceae bacterium]|nr:class I SAM-dependent methyltransferase [Mariprofundaceae bacterium]MDQ6994766.1 class I SAM-dependent methyltransferase [Mariprofundaceae bacterium]
MSKECLHAYTQEVLKFRKGLNLTSISQASVFDKRFIQPSVALAKWMPDEGRLLDIGSGMGVPGIPLLMMKPNLHGVLVERRKKRAEFLRHLRRKFTLKLDVYDADINDLPCLNIDICVARAVTRIEDLLLMCSQHVNPHAIAIFPVPREQAAVAVEGWVLEAVHDVRAVESQQIQCYRWEGVSRET